MTNLPLSRLCVHTITTKPWSLREAIDAYQREGVGGITVWRDAVRQAGLAESRRLLDASGLKVVSLCRGGFFPGKTAADRQKAIDENKTCIDEAHAVGAPLIVLVCGAVPGISLVEARKQIADGIAAVAPYAAQANVKLGIEPLHPMYAGDRSAVSTLGQSNDLVEAIRQPNVGVALDVYHTWWDDHLEAEIARCARLDALYSFHVCDWLAPTRDFLNDRGLMGDGVIPIRRIRQWVEGAGYDGLIEVEIFSTEQWKTDQGDYLKRICRAFQEHV